MAVTIHNDVQVSLWKLFGLYILISASALERSNHYMKFLMDQIFKNILF